VTWPCPPGPMDRARDELARRAETRHPGWTLAHGLYGWTGTRTSDQRTETATSLPGLLALISVVATAPPTACATRPGTAP
jgi:hypothetical protein